MTVTGAMGGRRTSGPQPPQVIAFTGPAGGAGRTTVLAHLAVALLQRGIAVGVLDASSGTDGDVTRWLVARAGRQDTRLVAPAHLQTGSLRGRSAPLWEQIAALRAVCDVVLMDAPAGHGGAVAAALSQADLAVSVLTDHGWAAARLMAEDVARGVGRRPGPHARVVWAQRRERRARDAAGLDWVLLRNRTLIGARDDDATLGAMWTQVARLLGARLCGPILEHIAWREGLPDGLTALDPPFDAGDVTAALYDDAATPAPRLMMETLAEALGWADLEPRRAVS